MKYILRSRVTKVEENFEKIYKAESVGEAKVESQIESTRISKGWFVSLEGWGISIRLSDVQPDLKVGDELVIEIRKASDENRS